MNLMDYERKIETDYNKRLKVTDMLTISGLTECADKTFIDRPTKEKTTIKM